MLYEYHLEDGTIELSTEPNITSFNTCVYSAWDDELQDLIEEFVDIPVKYCLIKEE